MRLYHANDLGIDVLATLSAGYHIIEYLDSSGFYVAYRSDGTTPVNIIESHAWLDEKKLIVPRAKYTDYSTQIPLPIVSYDLISDSPLPLEVGSGVHTKNYNLSLLVHAENKAQLMNLGGFLEALLVSKPIPVLNFNVTNNPQIGVIRCRDLFKTKIYDLFQETNLANKFAISISCTAETEFDNNYSVG